MEYLFVLLQISRIFCSKTLQKYKFGSIGGTPSTSRSWALVSRTVTPGPSPPGDGVPAPPR